MFGEILKKLRVTNDMTQSELGERIGVSKVSISKYENGNQFPDTDTLQKIADVFRVSTDYLLGRNQNEDISNKLQDLAFDNLDGLTEEDLKKVNDYVKLIKRHREEINKIEDNLKGE
ncbi:helix-turn-helix domain-containing protein [Listeria booriae]|uniref:helix-turn-helix domain-containing protein n=1 Tax=Listeria booriae TaxID=1552123 RepID=UPI0016291F09|nr:helix-turn-helix transcriptional regulator [Listeria booriae]MBC1235225.1 helix-turn-helix domain-containing protein [Listeria booriae]MBC1247323.1 helix-turn-helix domain-containing protein [Listeria booriae]